MNEAAEAGQPNAQQAADHRKQRRIERLSELMWPYLQAMQDGGDTGEPEFDRNVFSAAGLANFLARKVVETPDDDFA